MSETPPSSKPNYGSAIRVAQIVHWLHEFPYGVSLAELRSRLGISERTLARYIQTLKESFFDEDGEPLVEVTKGGGQGRLRFKRRGVDLEGTAYELMSLYMALEMMTFLEGTFIQDFAQEALDRLQNQLRGHHETSLVLKDFHKKFCHWSEAPKDYKDHNETLDQLVKALVGQRQIEIEYSKAGGGPVKNHLLQPLSLLMYKRALYLIGRKHKEGKSYDVTFAVERIKKVSRTEQTFAYPGDYDPQNRFQNHFGLVQAGEPEEVVLRFEKEVVRSINSRQWHSSQAFTENPDGTLDLSMNLAAGDELIGWILSYGSYVTVLEPPSLREKMQDRIKNMMNRYS